MRKETKELVDTECGICGRELKNYPAEKLGLFGTGICRECEQLVKKEKEEWKKHGVAVSDLGGGLVLGSLSPPPSPHRRRK
jgi:hypothetical protein